MINKTKSSIKKRAVDVISWNDYFLSVAFLSSRRSKDPNTQVGVCIVNEENKIISTGYNGTIKHFSDDDVLWNNDSKLIGKNKYSYLVDAEINAIINAKRIENLTSAAIYITHYPCNNCLKAILQCGIKKIYFCYAKHSEHYDNEASKVLIKHLEIKIKQLPFPDKWINNF